jgi:hypothetical protein
MDVLPIIRGIQACLIGIIGLLCVGFLDQTLVGVMCFIVSAFYIHLSIEGV